MVVGERPVFISNMLTLDHNLPRTAFGRGQVVCTNYKLVFLPYENKGIQEQSMTQAQFESLHTP